MYQNPSREKKLQVDKDKKIGRNKMFYYLECLLHATGLLAWYVFRHAETEIRQVLILYLGCGMVLHTMHRLGHDDTFWHKWYIAHTFGHHQQAYPSIKFTSENDYVKNNHDEWHLNVVTYTVGSAGFLLGCWTVFESGMREMLIDMMAVSLLLLFENSIHNAIHFPSPWKNLRQKFSPLDDLISRAHDRHLLHHQHKRVHYAMVAWWFDWIMGTYYME